MRKLVSFVVSLGLLGVVVPARAETSNWAFAAVASSEYGGSVKVDDPSGQLGGQTVGTSQCTSTLEGLVNEVDSVDELANFAISIAWGLLQEAGVPLPGDPPQIPNVIDLPPVDLPDGCTPAIGVNGVESGNWSAERATGAPDTYPSCGDIFTAWAPQSSGPAPESITLLYSPVSNAQRVDIYETNLGSFVSQVNVHAEDGSSTSVFTGPDTTGCPGILSIPLSGNPTVVGVEIHTQKLGWEEIDAVAVVN
jgi:hypothetical protein